MRILYHHRTLGDGAEGIHIREIVEALRGLGHQVHVNAFTGHQTLTQTKRVKLLSTLRGYMPKAAYETAQLAHGLVSASSFERLIKTFKPDFVYKRHARYDFGVILACRRARIPVILEVNCVYSAPSISRFEPVAFPSVLRKTERWVFQHVAKNIAVSGPLAEELRIVAPRADVVVLPNGVNRVRFRPTSQGERIRRELGIEGKRVVGFIGTLWKWHGLEFLLEAIRDVQHPDVHLLIVGDGEMRVPLMALARQLGIEHKVTFTGLVAHEEVPGYVAAMEVTVLPAEHREHASPMKMIEYMAMGKPVIAPRMRNIMEIVTDQREALLFPPNDRAALVACITRLIAQPDFGEVLGRNARNRVESELNWENNAAKIIALYESLSGVRETRMSA